MKNFAGDYKQINTETVLNLVAALNKPDLPQNEMDPFVVDSDVVGQILGSHRAVDKMAKYYRNKLEIAMLSDVKKENIDRIISDYAANRVKYIRLHPLFPEIEKDEKLRNDLCEQLEERIKSEIGLLYRQAAPFGYTLVMKHFLPDIIDNFEEEDIFLNSTFPTDFHGAYEEAALEYKAIGLENDNKRVTGAAYGKILREDRFGSSEIRIEHRFPENMPGVEIHANAIDDLLKNEYLEKSGILINYLVLLAFVTIILFFTSRFTPLLSAALSILVYISYFFLHNYLIFCDNYLI